MSSTMTTPHGMPASAEQVAGAFARLRSDLALVASWAQAESAGGARLGGESLGQALTELVALGGVLDAHTVADAWRAEGYWGLDGSRSAPVTLARQTGRSIGSCRALLARARKVHTSMPATRDAWASGAVSTDAVDVLTAANTTPRATIFERDEPVLVSQASRLRHAQLVKAVQYWKHRADAELADDGTPPEPETFLSLHRTFDGAMSLSGVLDPVGGAIVEETLRLIDDELRAANTATGQTRTPGARHAAALVEMATRARSLPGGDAGPSGSRRRPAPLFTVILGEQAFASTCELFTGQVITPTNLRAWLTDAAVQFFPFHTTPPSPADANACGTRGDGGTPADPVAASRKHARFFTGALRTAIQLRDRHCQHPCGCDEPISRCDIDHITPHSRGGATTLTAGRLLCTAHNRIPTLRNPASRDQRMRDPSMRESGTRDPRPPSEPMPAAMIRSGTT